MLANLGFGMVAACSATLVVHPLDVARVRAQVNGSGKGWLSTLVKSARTDGLASVYDGLSANLLRQLFYGGVRFGVFSSVTRFFYHIIEHISELRRKTK